MRTPVLIVGGGLAGLVASLELARQGIEVVVFEKKDYPAHKVCGEYVSNEVRPYLERLGLPLTKMGAVPVSTLVLSSPGGRILTTPLDSGGFGISRHLLDHSLYRLALAAGVTFQCNTTVTRVEQTGGGYSLITGQGARYQSEIIIGAYGKRSRLDRQHIRERSPYMAVKYHVSCDLPREQIALHNFRNGYCGISAIEGDRYCLCYLTHRSNLRNSRTIAAMEAEVLGQNPFLKAIFKKAEFHFDKPLVINEISFARKGPVSGAMPMAGDAAGMIAPLCGNGMAMAIHSGKLASEKILHYLQGRESYSRMLAAYAQEWDRRFAARLQTGRIIQSLFGRNFVTEATLSVLKHSPALTRAIIRQTHGEVLS